MAPRLSDVWLRLYQLCEAIEFRGVGFDEQLKAIAEELQTMVPEVQQQSKMRLELLRRLADELANELKV